MDTINGNVTNATNCNSSILNCTKTIGGQEESTNPFVLPWYVQFVYIIFFVFVVVIGAGGNIIVIWIVLAHKRMRTVTNYFLVNLAVADALISIFNVLFSFIYMLDNDWKFGRSYCKFSMFLSVCAISASVFTFMAIAIDRYIAIIHPLKPRMRASTVLGVIAVIWISSAGVGFPNIIYAETETDVRTVCILIWPDGLYNTHDFIYNIFVMLVNYFLPLLILTVTYTRVGIELWGSRAIGENTDKQMASVRSKRKVVKMMMLVVLIFGICWLPQHVYFLLTYTIPTMIETRAIQHIYLIIYWLAMSNSMYNPIIYCWMNAKFRRGFKYVFRWCPCVKWTVKESLSHGGTITRMSVSEGTKFERNGSLMHTMVEGLDDTCYGTSSPGNTQFSSLREDDQL